jgi:hypothetical protein
MMATDKGETTSYVRNDPVNLVDPDGRIPVGPSTIITVTAQLDFKIGDVPLVSLSRGDCTRSRATSAAIPALSIAGRSGFQRHFEGTPRGVMEILERQYVSAFESGIFNAGTGRGDRKPDC